MSEIGVEPLKIYNGVFEFLWLAVQKNEFGNEMEKFQVAKQFAKHFYGVSMAPDTSNDDAIHEIIITEINKIYVIEI